MSYARFIADPARRDEWLVELSPKDPGTGSAVDGLFYSLSGWRTAKTDTPSLRLYRARVLEALNVGLPSVTQRTIGGIDAVSGGEIRIGMVDADLTGWKDYYWPGASVIVRHGGYSPALGRRLTFSEFRVFMLAVEDIDIGIDEIRVRVREKRRMFDEPFEGRYYRGQRWCLDVGVANYVSFGGVGVPSAVDIRTGIYVGLSVWFDSAGMGTIRRLVGWDHNGATTYPFQVRINSSNQVVFRDSLGTVLETSTATVSASRWTDIDISIIGTAYTMILYDHQTDTETVETATVSSTARPAPDQLFRVGHASAGHDGMIRRCWIANAGRTASQVRNLRFRKLTASELTVTSWKMVLDFEDGTGTTITDRATSGTNGTLTGAGTAWYPALEGSVDTAGMVKPNALGKQLHAGAPLAFDLSPQIFQVHVGDISASALTMYEGGYSGGRTLGTAYTDMKTFLAATTASGKFDVLRSANGSYVRVFSTVALPAGFAFEGDNTGGTYRTKAADLARWAVTYRGRHRLSDPSEIDTTSITNLNSANSATQGWFIDKEIDTSAVIDRLLGGIGAVWWIAEDTGLFTVYRYTGVTGKTAAGRYRVTHIKGVTPLGRETPVERVKVTYGHNHLPIDTGNLNANVLGTTTQRFFENPFRYASARSSDAETNFEHSEPMIRESVMTEVSDAQAEAERLILLHANDDVMPYSIELINGASLKRYDEIDVALPLPTRGGGSVNHLGWGASKAMIVLGVNPQQGTGSVVVEAAG